MNKSNNVSTLVATENEFGNAKMTINEEIMKVEADNGDLHVHKQAEADNGDLHVHKMTRWDEILSLPVQNPSTMEFAACDLVWSKIKGPRGNLDRLALIPFDRVNDFSHGESNNKDCPTRFYVEARRKRHMPYKPKADDFLEYALYWCSFGPADHRKGGVVIPSRVSYIRDRRSAGRPITRKGCTCHFVVKRLTAKPSAALIIYNHDKHVDTNGLLCHGPTSSSGSTFAEA